MFACIAVVMWLLLDTSNGHFQCEPELPVVPLIFFLHLVITSASSLDWTKPFVCLTPSYQVVLDISCLVHMEVVKRMSLSVVQS